MERKFMNTLIQWKKDPNKKPLMVIGARQVGKTYIIDQFCKKEYTEYIYINFDKDERNEDFFSESLDPEVIMPKIEANIGKKIEVENTIIFFDEIQKSERAINSLKYFCESEKKYNIVCAGSLLGVKINRYKSSFPVGKVRIENLYPLDFEEFLDVTNNHLLATQIKKCYNSLTPMAEKLHIKAMGLYKQYICTGGMPAAIVEYINSGMNIAEYKDIEKDNIITSYIADMTKYTTNTESIKIHQIYKSLSVQLRKR